MRVQLAGKALAAFGGGKSSARDSETAASVHRRPRSSRPSGLTGHLFLFASQMIVCVCVYTVFPYLKREMPCNLAPVHSFSLYLSISLEVEQYLKVSLSIRTKTLFRIAQAEPISRSSSAERGVLLFLRCVVASLTLLIVALL